MIHPSVLPLTSNGLVVDHRRGRLGALQDSTSLLPDSARLRAVFVEDGYALIRNLLDRDAVLALRTAYLAEFDAADPDLPHGVDGHPANGFVRSTVFAEFLARSPLADVAASLLGASVVTLPRCILRHYHRGTRRASRVHRDAAYIRAGGGGIVTAWVPLGDCPVGGGGLLYLEDSQHVDVAPVAVARVTDRPADRRPLSHDVDFVGRRLRRRWLTTHYRAGDVVFHNESIIHSSLDVNTPEPRVSVDVRFARAGDDVDPRWRRPWSGDDGY